MTKSKFALVVDSLFLSSITALIIFLWFKKTIKNANLFYFLLFLLFSLLFCIVLFLFFRSNNKKLFKKNNEKFLNKCLDTLIIFPQKNYQEFLCKLLNCTHIENYLFKLDNNILYINIKTELTANDYFLAQESIEDISRITKLYFIFKSKDKSFDNIILLSNLNIELIESETLLHIMSAKNIFPIANIPPSKTPFKTKLLKNLKSKSEVITNKHFKEFFFSGLSLLFLSLITPFSNYYLVIGSILIIISIISIFRKNYHTQSHSLDFLSNNKKEQ